MPRGIEWVIILVIVLLVWGAPKLPGLAKSIAQSMKIFKTEMKPEEKPKAESDTPAEGDKPAQK
jgi:sec-independent protein translocase protein TatA